MLFGSKKVQIKSPGNMFVILRPCLRCRPVVSQQVLAIESQLPYVQH